MTTRSRQWAATLGLAGLLAVLLVAITGPVADRTAHAQEQLDASALGLEVEAGFAGQALRNTAMPVTVRMQPDRLFAGVIEVATGNGLTEQREVEVAAGAEKAFTFVVPSGSVRVRARPDGSDQAVQVTPDINGSPGGVLTGIGTSTSIAGVPNTAVRGTEERVLWVAFDPTLLERSHRVAASLGTLVLTSDDLDALGEAGLRNLDAAVLDGLGLVVTVPSGSVPDGLPIAPATSVTTGTGGLPEVVPADAAWVLTAADAGLDQATPAMAVAAGAPHGLGRVVITGLEVNRGPGASANAWAHLIAQREATQQLDGEFSTNQGWLVPQLLSGSGSLGLPALGLLAGFALLYVLAVGPGNALLLRRLGRRELGWVTVPIITAVFLLGAFFTASGTQPKVGLAGSIRAWTNGVGQETAIAAVRAPAQGEHDITLPGPDWVVDGSADFNGVRSIVDRSAGNVRAVMDLRALQVGTVLGRRSIDEAPPLDLRISPAADGGLTVEVTNVSTVAIDRVQVRHGGRSFELGTLAPGAADEVTVTSGQLEQLPVYRDIWQEFGEGQFDRRLATPHAMRVLLLGTALSDRPGQVVVVGDLADVDRGVMADGDSVISLGGIVAVAQDVPADAGVDPTDVSRSLLVGAFQHGWQPSPHAVEGQLTAFLRFRLPAAAAGRVSALTPDVDRGDGFVEGGFFPQPEPLPVPGGGDLCLRLSETFPDGGASGSESCGDINPEPPACPDDAVACEFFAGGGWFFEFEDGRTQRGEVVVNEVFIEPQFQPGNGGRIADILEVFNHAKGGWDRVGDATVNGQLSTAYLSPFGEVLLRASGGMHPFDYSAIGIGAELGGAA